MGLETGIKKISGDGISLNLHSNEQILEVTGDGCCITVSKNRGSVKIIGDGCRLRIDQNMGDVEYNGDGGRVHLGPKSIKDKVKYIGDGGRVSFGGDSKRGRSRIPKEDVGGDPESARGMNSAKVSSNLGPGSREQRENIANEKRETKLGAEGDKGVEKERSVKTKIVTTLEYDEKIVKRCFVNPEAVVKTLNGVSFVKIAPRQTIIKIQVK